jgi:cell wall-associated NlpC family hydrolase
MLNGLKWIVLCLLTVTLWACGTDTSTNIKQTTQAQIVVPVAMRQTPNVSDNLIRYLKKGEQVSILSKTSAGWYKISDKNGKSGYITTNKQYVKILTTTTPTPLPAPVQTPTPAPTQTPATIGTSAEALKVINAGKKYLGVPYEFGSNRKTTTTFDCSDFVRTAFWEGIQLKLPYDSRTQADYVRNVGKTSSRWQNLKPGDILFFMSYRGSKAANYANLDKSAQRITHDGIYLGNGRMLHTYSTESGGVKYENIANSHWDYRFIFGGSAIQ